MNRRGGKKVMEATNERLRTSIFQPAMDDYKGRDVFIKSKCFLKKSK